MSTATSAIAGGEIYRRHQIRSPQSCTVHTEKLENIRRHMQAIEDTHRELMTIQDRLDFANKVYTFGRLVKDSSIAFLDLAGALVGGKAGLVGSIGNSAIETAGAVSEYAHGQIDGTTLSLRTANAMASAAQPKGAGGQFAAMSARQALGTANTVNDMRNAPSHEAALASGIQGNVNVMANTVKDMAEMASSAPTDNYAKVGRAAALVQAAYNYQNALNQTFEQRLQTEDDIRSTRQVYLHNNRMTMQRLRSQYGEALELLQSCMSGGGR